MDHVSLRDALSPYYVSHGLPSDGGEGSRSYLIALLNMSVASLRQELHIAPSA